MNVRRFDENKPSLKNHVSYCVHLQSLIINSDLIFFLIIIHLSTFYITNNLNHSPHCIKSCKYNTLCWLQTVSSGQFSKFNLIFTLHRRLISVCTLIVGNLWELWHPKPVQLLRDAWIELKFSFYWGICAKKRLANAKTFLFHFSSYNSRERKVCSREWCQTLLRERVCKVECCCFISSGALLFLQVVKCAQLSNTRTRHAVSFHIVGRIMKWNEKNWCRRRRCSATARCIFKYYPAITKNLYCLKMGPSATPPHIKISFLPRFFCECVRCWLSARATENFNKKSFQLLQPAVEKETWQPNSFQ